MTIPSERANAVLYTESFLKDLLSPKITPKVPKYIRDRAKHLLRHYPSVFDLKTVQYGWDSKAIVQCPFDTGENNE